MITKHAKNGNKSYRKTKQEVGESEFYLNNSIQDITLQNGVRSLGPWSFGFCSALKTVFIPESVIDIHPSAFDGCCALEEIKVDPDNSKFSCKDGILFDREGTTLLLFPHGKKVSSVSIETPIVYIGDNAFNRSMHIEMIHIGESVKEIGYKSFAFCNKLHNVFIPESVEYIGYCAFANCINVESFSVDNRNSSYRDIDGCLFSKDGTELIQFPLGKEETEYYIEKHICSIKDRAFSCSRLNNVTVAPDNNSYKDIDGVLFSKNGKILIYYPTERNDVHYKVPSGVEIISNSAFRRNKYLEGITFPASLKEIERHAFEGCAGLRELVFYDTKLQEIGWSAFAECNSLTSVVLSRMTKCIIQGHAFFDCDGLKTITCPNENPTLGFDTFGGSTPATLNV